MDKQHFEEMKQNLKELLQEKSIFKKNIYLFGHCNASEELIELLERYNLSPKAIMDNNKEKHGTDYKGIAIVSPNEILEDKEESIVCVVARAYESMAAQLRALGYIGEVRKLVDYNTYSEYSLSDETRERKVQRVQQGINHLEQMRKAYPDCYKVFCPFSALGDVYFMMSYLPYFLDKRGKKQFVVAVIGNACASVVKMFGAEHVEAYSQKEMDELIQAVLYTRDEESYIPHQDRPYIADLYKALYIKMIPLEKIYRCGVFGLSEETVPYGPSQLQKYEKLDQIAEGNSVILSPYAKSVTNIPMKYWEKIVEHYVLKGYELYTNAIGEEMALPGTTRIEIPLAQIQSVVERAGVFIGLRSGLCDVIRDADCKKIALYPDCYYSDTRWKMAEIYHLAGWENIVIK